ncbi:MAG: hypothetical protein OER04_17880 [Cyclobacteriaceae bacterium]|nr:hypothetical protein [Cyclobacteriaceae bacterium]
MRKYLAVILGTVISNVIFLIIGVLANTISPTPPELMDSRTPEAVAQRVAATPTFTWISVIVGLAVGAFFGGMLGAKTAKSEKLWVTTGVGLLLSVWAFYTFYIVYPDVLWVPLAMLVSGFLFSFLGGLIFGRSAPTNPPLTN